MKTRVSQKIHVPGSGRAREKKCIVCRKDLPIAKTGRPRLTCSDKCRQKKKRRRSEEDREWALATRRAEKQIRAWERKFGSFDYPNDPGWPKLTFRFRLLFRLQRSIPVPECNHCGKPFVRDEGSGLPMRYCSATCHEKEKKAQQAGVKALKAHPEKAHPLTHVHLEMEGKIRACKWCSAAFPLYQPGKKFCSDKCRQAMWRKRHPRRTCPECGKRFYARPQKGTQGAGGRPQVYCGRTCYYRMWERIRPDRNRRKEARYVTAEAATPLTGESGRVL